MLPKNKIDRINELAGKAKKSSLNEKEIEEQATLRKEYLIAFRESFIQQLENIEIVDQELEDCQEEFEN